MRIESRNIALFITVSLYPAQWLVILDHWMNAWWANGKCGQGLTSSHIRQRGKGMKRWLSQVLCYMLYNFYFHLTLTIIPGLLLWVASSYRKGKQGSERLTFLAKDTQQGTERSRIQTQDCFQCKYWETALDSKDLVGELNLLSLTGRVNWCKSLPFWVCVFVKRRWWYLLKSSWQK